MAHDTEVSVKEIQHLIIEQEKSIKEFMLEICAIPSIDGQIADVARRVEKELIDLGYESIRYDKMGCILGQMGTGSTKILYDAHLDTVGIGDPSDWKWDPYKGKIEDQTLYARGACDTKGSVVGMVYGIAFAKRLGLLKGTEAIFYGSLEEQCDGLAPRYLMEQEKYTLGS